jgi:hypothetical protein
MYDESVRAWCEMRDAVIPRIKELKLKGLTYKTITTELQKDYPNMGLTESCVSKWGLRELGSMTRYRKTEDGGLTPRGYDIFVSAEVVKLLEDARERLRVDLGKKYLPSYSETIKDLLDKC